jgi:hypothetical protein
MHMELIMTFTIPSSSFKIIFSTHNVSVPSASLHYILNLVMQVLVTYQLSIFLKERAHLLPQHFYLLECSLSFFIYHF